MIQTIRKGERSPRFKSLIKNSLFILLCTAGHWRTRSRDPANERERVQYIIKTKPTFGKARQMQKCCLNDVYTNQYFFLLFCLSRCLTRFVCPFSISIYLSIHLYIHLSIYLSIHTSIYLSISYRRHGLQGGYNNAHDMSFYFLFDSEHC